MSATRLLLMASAVLLLANAPASAACYENVGCTDGNRFSAQQLRALASCQVLWEMRNGIFKENGYCFQTSRAIRTFGNAGCEYDDVDAVPLSKIERSNVEAIRRAERLKRC